MPFVVRPGDSVTVTIAEQSANNWSIDFKNNTTGKTYHTTRRYTSSHSSAEWVVEAPSSYNGVLPLDNFGNVSFTEATATQNGQSGQSEPDARAADHDAGQQRPEAGGAERASVAMAAASAWRARKPRRPALARRDAARARALALARVPAALALGQALALARARASALARGSARAPASAFIRDP